MATTTHAGLHFPAIKLHHATLRRSLFGFLALAALNSLGVIPAVVRDAVGQISAFLIITSIAALGMKTSLLALVRIGMAPVMLLITETVFVGLLVVGLIYGLRAAGL